MSVLDRVKSIDPKVWLLGGAGVVAVFVLTRGSGSGSTGASGVSGAGGGGGGGADVDTLETLSMGLSDLAGQLEAANEEDAAWRKTIEDRLAAGAPANPAHDGHPRVSLGPAVKAKAGIRASYSPSSLATALKRAGVNPGSVISLAEIERALKKEHINYGATITKSDVAKLYRKTNVTPVKPKP